MKLAEALVERADLNRKLNELRERIIRNAKFQEGDKPAEDPVELLKEYDKAVAALEVLIVRINSTNNVLKLPSGRTMVSALAQRDMLKIQHATYKALASEATPKQDRYSQKEIKFVSAIVVKEMQAKADALAQSYRQIDTEIQAANWSNDLQL